MFEFSDFPRKHKMQGKILYFDSLGKDNLRVILLSVMKLMGRFGQFEIGCKDQDDDEEEVEREFTSDNC